MAEKPVQRRLAAILAADVVGYSRLMGLDEDGTLAALRTLRAEVIEPKIAEHQGRLFKTTGDGFLAEFPSVVNAVTGAAAIQMAMAGRNADLPEGRAMQLRIGVHLGDVISEGVDVYGDGVNVAARIEGLAPPGGIAVSAMVYDNVGNRLDLTFEDLGEKQLKNIAKPTRVFQVRLENDNGPTSQQPRERDIPLSIAVLPFDNMSGIPEQDYIGDGIAENIITDLSRFRDLTVIARNSSFAYKGKSTRVQDIRRDLGVDYILEGSVQKLGDRIRVTGQLIEGASGKHLWAERYDRRADDLFALMDEITALIVGTLGTTYGGRLRKAASEVAQGAGPTSFRAFDHFVQGMQELNKFTKDSVERSLKHFKKATQINPRYAKVHAKVTWAHLVNLNFGWSADETHSWNLAREAADAAVTADDAEAWAHWAVAGCAMFRGEHDLALESMRRALTLNPNDADVLADMGLFCAYAGKAEEGVDYALKSMRLNPHYPEYYADQLGKIYFDARRYEDSVRTLASIRSLCTPTILIYLAASHAALGNDSAARSAVERLLQGEPQSTVSYWTSARTAPYRENSDREHLAHYLRKAGVPE